MEGFKYTELPMGFYVPEERLKFGVDVTWPIHLEPKSMTMNKKLAINVAPVGALISRSQNPTQPYEPAEVAKEVIESYKAGATMFHIHCRKNGEHAVDPQVYKETLDLVFKEAPDIITNLCIISASNQEGREKRTKPLVGPLHELGGKKYGQIAIVNARSFSMGQTPPFIATPAGVRDETAYMEEVGVKPFFAIPDPASIDTIVHNVIETGIAKKPYYFGIGTGVHETPPSTPDPEGYYNFLQLWKRLPKVDTVWEAAMGGRNWLPMTIFAIMMGADIVRVGKEDAIYKYPYKDDYITSCAECVSAVATIARALGREIMTPAETKQLLNLQD